MTTSTEPQATEDFFSIGSAFEGIKVLDFTQLASGPSCTQLLADLGANVIKVEPPTGDVGRTLGPPWIEGVGVGFLALNRNKRSIVLDLKSEEGLKAALDLATTCDVVVENFRPGVMKRLKLGFHELRELNPNIILCSVSAYGQTGPWKGRAGVDGVIQAVSGLMSITGEKGSGPIKVQAPIVDLTTGFLAAFSVAAAIQAVRRGQGAKWIDVSMLEASTMLQQTSIDSYSASGELPTLWGSAAPYAAPNEAFPTADGWIMIAAYQQDRWARLCQSLSLSELIEDARFVELKHRVANRGEMVDELGKVLRTDTTKAWVKLLEAADVLCAPIATYEVVAELPPIQERGLMVPTQLPDGQVADFVGCGFSGMGHRVLRRLPPALGDHTDEILEGGW